jgi:hypothetical protein
MKNPGFFAFVVFGILFAGCDVDPDAIYHVIYHPSGEETSGFAPIDDKEYKSGDEAVVRGKHTLLKTGYTFRHWNTKKDGSGVSYVEGAKLKINKRTVFLYPIWEQDQ